MITKERSTSDQIIPRGRPGPREEPAAAPVAVREPVENLRGTTLFHVKTPALVLGPPPAGDLVPGGAVRIRGERFLLEEEDDTYFVRHPRWGLVGAGESLPEAMDDLLESAHVALQTYLNKQPSELTLDGYQYRSFLLGFA